MLLLVSVFFMSFAFAEDIKIADLCKEESVVGVKVPSGVPFSNEVFNVYLAGESVGSIILTQKKIASVSCDEHDKPTYNIMIESEDVVKTIIASEDMIDEYHKQRKSGALEIDAVGFFRTIKLGFINFFSKFF